MMQILFKYKPKASPLNPKELIFNNQSTLSNLEVANLSQSKG